VLDMVHETGSSPLRHGVIPERIREKVVQKCGNKCAMCGVDGELNPLEFAFIQSLTAGGEVSEENLTMLCPICHSRLDAEPREVEFVAFLAELLKKNSKYEDVRTEALIGQNTRFRADLLAERKGPPTERILIECKKTAIPARQLPQLLEQLRAYQLAYGQSRLILALPATLPPSSVEMLKVNNVEVWDLQYIATNFKSEILKADSGYYRLLFASHMGRSANLSIERKLIAQLKKTEPGMKDWSVYQSLVGEILELLFTPPLLKPLSELSDASKTNRRDFIMPNYAEEGFWAFLRSRYMADYVVVDAKNYIGKIKKAQVLQLANYLKIHGAGLLGMIICRKGADSGGCQVTLREQWIMHQKLILVLTDEDLEEMLLARSDNGKPEEVVGRKIEEFRLSM
jgi:hypothetical protein